MAFYFLNESSYVLVLLAAIFIAWFFGIKIENQGDEKKRSRVLAQGTMLTILILLIFKYGNFIVENLNHLLVACKFPSLIVSPPNIHLPIGISFFTFQVVSYLCDVYRKDIPAQRDLEKVAVYKSFFPQLIAGPIVRYKDVKSFIDYRTTTNTDLLIGTRYFALGLIQKVLVADELGRIADQIFILNPSQLSTYASWIATIAYTIQIYYDFNGYTNMAIGLGRIFGFQFPQNFNFPYSADSITDFWRRWHITLSSWFRDYLYIPLGGNRKTTIRTYLNLYIVFFLCGLWHGPSWTFISWGLFHGTLIAIEKAFLLKHLRHLFYWIRNVYLLFVVMVGWVLFRSTSFNQAFEFYQSMFSFRSDETVSAILARYFSPASWTVLLAAFIFSYPLKKGNFNIESLSLAKDFFLLLLFCLSLLALTASTFHPFIYSRF